MQNPADFGSWLRRARGARDLTQEALAEAVGCATQTIRSFEIGRRRPSREMATRIAVAVAAPVPIALDELAALAALEIDQHPAAALATLAYVRCHPLTRPPTRAAVERRWLAASSNATPDQLAAAEAAAVAFPPDRPVDLLDLLGLR